MLRVRNAGLPRKETSLATASSHMGLRFGYVAANMRKLYGSRGGGSCQVALITEGADGPLESDKYQEVCVAYKKRQATRGGGEAGRFPQKWWG